MAHLKAYTTERMSVAANFPDLVDAPCTFEDAEILIRRLSEEHGVHIRAITPTSGRNMSMWIPRERRIKLNVSKIGLISWRVAVHEFAHALDEKFRPQSARWHDTVFVDTVLDLCAVVVKRGWHRSIPEERKAAQAANAAQRADREAARAVREAARNAPAAVRARKIERRRAQILRMERRIKMLSTRLKSAKRSLAALERAERKMAAAPPEATA